MIIQILSKGMQKEKKKKKKKKKTVSMFHLKTIESETQLGI